MTEAWQVCAEQIQKSRNYRDLCPDTVLRVTREAFSRHAKPKDAEKAARAQLHQISGAFITPADLARAEALLPLAASGARGALLPMAALHASTRERLPYYEPLYREVLEMAGRPARVLDLACGVNPLLLSELGADVYGIDIHGGTVRLVNAWADALKLPARAACADVLCEPALPDAQLTLLLKLLPVLEQQQKGGAMRTLSSARSAYALVSFPMRSLSGRGASFEAHYTEWFERNLPDTHAIASRFTRGGELFYFLERRI